MNRLEMIRGGGGEDLMMLFAFVVERFVPRERKGGIERERKRGRERMVVMTWKSPLATTIPTPLSTTLPFPLLFPCRQKGKTNSTVRISPDVEGVGGGQLREWGQYRICVILLCEIESCQGGEEGSGRQQLRFVPMELHA
jgi:hypothetical protein